MILACCSAGLLASFASTCSGNQLFQNWRQRACVGWPARKTRLVKSRLPDAVVYFKGFNSSVGKCCKSTQMNQHNMHSKVFAGEHHAPLKYWRCWLTPVLPGHDICFLPAIPDPFGLITACRYTSMYHKTRKCYVYVSLCLCVVLLC